MKSHLVICVHTCTWIKENLVVKGTSHVLIKGEELLLESKHYN